MLEEVASKLPKKEEKFKKVHESCERRRKFITTDKKDYFKHLEKSKNDFASIKYDYDNKVWNWVIIKAYYAIHHAANALLVNKKGLFSKDHVCTMIALRRFGLIPEEFYNKLNEIYGKFEDVSAFSLIFEMRKISQYSVEEWKNITKNDAEIIFRFAKTFISFVEQECAG